MKQLKDYYDEPIRVFADDVDNIAEDFMLDLVRKYGKVIRRAVKSGERYINAVQLLLDLEWSMVYGSVMRDYSTHVTISPTEDCIHVTFESKFIYD